MLSCQSCARAVAAWIFAGLLATQPAFSQTRLPETPAASSVINAQPTHALSGDFQKRLAHMTKRYKLTVPQQAQVQSILLKEQQDQQTVSADRYMSGKDRHEEQASLFEADQQKIRAVLTPHQQRKFDADEKRRAWMGGRLPNPNPGPPPF
jgi:Spy/CpxP family protein refolding chaperone